jgi:NADH:ubiquinone oxidoreductase subunit 5 (subunit L)/multisubunit Na+/H+ antiporter MnhA subunit
MSADVWFAALALAVVVAPALAFVPVTLALLVGRAPAERTVGRLAFGAVTVSFASAVALALLWLTGERAAVDLHVARWFGVGHYGFDVAYLVDRLSMTLLPLVTGVVLVITRFAIPYLHREPGFARFFGQLMLFAVGESLVVLAGSADVLIIGWECVGLSSALLVAFFHERAAPARAAVRVFTTYRLCDIGLLVGAMALHRVTGSSDFTQAFRTTGWPGGPAPIPVLGATALALCLGLAAAGKSAQLPVGNWLAQAMEGPTPSSALFYGGPAVHTGVFLLLRLAPLFERASLASAFLVGIGLITSLHATLAWRVQTDQKSALAYATMTQLGLIVAECGLGWWMVALAHTVAHLCLRTFQLLRAPSALHDAHILWATSHGRPVPALEMLPRVAPGALYRWLYRFGLERSYCDVVIDRYLVQPVLALGRRLDALERRGFAALGGLGVRRESDASPLSGALGEEVP